MSIDMNQLTMLIEKQDFRIAHLQSEVEKLKAWSDLNDHYLREMIDANTAVVDRILTVINDLHNNDEILSKLHDLEKEDKMPVAQLLKNFLEKNKE